MQTTIKDTGQKGQLVTFLLGHEVYGIDIFKIQEVIHFVDITAIPNSPPFVEGVIQVRDKVIPVVDLKKRLHVMENGAMKRRIIILELDGRPLGLVVDDIHQVLSLREMSVESLPEVLVEDYERDCIKHLAKTDNGLVIVIAAEKILTRQEKRALDEFKEAMDQGEADGEASFGDGEEVSSGDE